MEETGTPNLLFSLCNVVGDIRGILPSYLWPSITESDPLLSSLNGLASLALFTVSPGRGEEERGASALLLAAWMYRSWATNRVHAPLGPYLHFPQILLINVQTPNRNTVLSDWVQSNKDMKSALAVVWSQTVIGSVSHSSSDLTSWLTPRVALLFLLSAWVTDGVDIFCRNLLLSVVFYLIFKMIMRGSRFQSMEFSKTTPSQLLLNLKVKT